MPGYQSYANKSGFKNRFFGNQVHPMQKSIIRILSTTSLNNKNKNSKFV